MSDQKDDGVSLGTGVLVLGGAGLAVFGIIGYAAIKAGQAVAPYAVPLALGYKAPELLPYYEAAKQAKTPEERQNVIARGARVLGGQDDEGATFARPRVATPVATKASPVNKELVTGVIEKWQELDDGRIVGYVYGKKGFKDGEPIEISPKAVHDGFAYTGRSTYRLGNPEKGRKKV